MSWLVAFTILPYAFFALTMKTFVLPLNPERSTRILWTLFLLVCFSKFLAFAALGGHAFNPDLPTAVIWIWDGLYSGAMILSILAILTVLFRSRAKVWILPLLAWGLSIYGLANGLRVPQVRQIVLAFKNLPPALNGYRIVHLSDLHCSSATKHWRTAAIVESALACKPDLICLTGDSVDGPFASRAHDLEPILSLRAKDGVFACTGNHEYYSDYENWMTRFYQQSTSIRFLTNECAFPRPELALAGVPDPMGMLGGLDVAPDPYHAFAAATNGEFRILLQHRPNNARQYAQMLGVKLQLSGHTHGGIAPLFRTIVGWFNDGFTRGLYPLGSSYLYVSPGCGHWAGFPMRLFNDSEITLIILKGSAR